MKETDEGYENNLLIALCQHQLRQVTALQQPILEVLLERGAQLPLDFAELLEEAANVYLSASERISERYLEARQATHLPSTQTPYPRTETG